MGIISWIIVGALAGWIASVITGKNEGRSLVGNIVAGLIGAGVGGFLANLVGRNPVFGFTFTSLFVAVLGAVVFLALLGALQRD